MLQKKMKVEKPTKGRVLRITLPIAAFLACVLGTSTTLMFSGGRVKREKLVYGLNGATGTAALLGVILLSRFRKFDRALLCFIVPFLLTVLAMAVVLAAYKEPRLGIANPVTTGIAGLTGIVISGIAWIWLIVLWIFVCCGNIVAPLEEDDGDGDKDTAREDV